MTVSLSARCACPLLAAGVAALSLPALADNQGTVVVTAARAPQMLTDALPHTTVLQRVDIERSQAVDLPALLAAEAGVQFASNGGRGTATALFLRGAPSRQVLVLVDGLPLARQDASGQVGIEHLMLDQVERIEIVRGNVSALYGGGAVGGVIQIFTRRPGSQPQASVRLEAGSRGLVHGAAQGAAQFGATTVSLGLSRVSDKGFSALDPARQPAANPDRDGYGNTSAVFNLSHALAAGHRLGLGWVHSAGSLDYDSAFDTPADVQRSRSRKDLLSLRSDNELSAAWTSSTSLSTQREDVREHTTGSFGADSRYRTRSDALSWVNTLKLSPTATATAGLDVQRQSVEVDDGFGGLYDTGRTLWAVFGSAQWRLGAHHLSTSLRHDQVQGIGAHTSASLGWGWQLAPAWMAIAQVGNAFNVPPLGYLYAPYFGNPDLQPELSRSGELGLQYAAAGQRVRATVFHTRVRQELDYDPAAQRFGNVARTRNQGLELSYDGRLGASDLRASLTAQDPVDAGTGARRLRRSQVLASASVSHDLGGGWRAGLALRHAGQRPDAGGVVLPAYTVGDATVQWDLRAGWQWFARIENLGGARYETASGYQQAPRGIFTGLRWQLQ